MKYISGIRFLLTLILLLSSCLIVNRDALADIAPPSPPYGGNLTGGNVSTAVQMVSEKVTFAIAPYSNYRNGQATVTAFFQMRNQGSQDESMQVRFPLEWTGQGGSECAYSYTALYPPINDLKAWVDGVPVATTTDYVTADIQGDNANQVQVPCWANFPVTFPIDKDVNIRVQYTALGAGYLPSLNQRDDSWELAGDSPSAWTSFNYVLSTGAGWDGPISKADIIFQFPYPVTPDALNLTDEASLAAQNMAISGDMLIWHDENFKPDRDIGISLINPTVWLTIQEQTKTVQSDPKNGEAWGLLAKAYKQAAWSRRGLGPASMVKKSDQAYQQAISLLPDDAEWHFGYAELLCWRAMWPWEMPPDWVSCFQQLKTTLDLRPDDKRALAVLDEISRLRPELVDMSGPEPIYSILLTPSPTSLPEQPTGKAESETDLLSNTATLTPPTPDLTITPAATNKHNPEVTAFSSRPSATFNIATTPPTLQPSNSETSILQQGTPIPQSNGESQIWFYGVSGLVGLGVLIGLFYWLLVVRRSK